MATKRHRRLVSYTIEENALVVAQAAQVKLKVSEFLRRLSLGYHIPDANTFKGAEMIGDLLTVNADLARLGNLLKLTLDEADGQFVTPTVARIEALIAEIRHTQTAILGKVEDLHFEIHPRRKRRS